MNIGIILASGSGKRMGAGKNKLLLEVGGKPIIFHTLKIFEEIKEIDFVILVASKKDEKIFKRLISQNRIKKVKNIIIGGEERQYSAFNAVRFIDKKLKKEEKKSSVLIFHNGANLFVEEKEIIECIEMTKKFGASAVAHRAKDTVRRVNKRGISIGVVDRANLWNMQTPQVIRFFLAKRAFEKASRDGLLGTDDVSLVEYLKKPVKIIEASENNFKITTPIDIKVAEIIIKEKKCF